VSEAPDTATALAEVDQCLHAGRLAEAEELYRRLLRDRPAEVSALLGLGLIAHQTKRPRDALHLLVRVILLNPDIAVCHSNFSHACHILGQMNMAERHRRRVVALQPAAPLSRITLSEMLWQQGAYSEAVHHGKLAVCLDPTLFAAHGNLGAAFGSAGHPDLASRSFSRTVTLHPASAEAYANLASVLYSSRRMQDATAAGRRAAALAPDLAGAQDCLGLVFHSQDLQEHAVAAFVRALTLVPDLPMTLNNLGTALQASARLAAAKSCYRRALCLAPAYPAAYGNYANDSDLSCQSNEAVSHLGRAIRLAPNDAGIYCQCARNLQLRGLPGGAEDCHRRAVIHVPANFDAWNGMGALHVELGRLSLADTELSRALVLRPDHSRCWRNRLTCATYRDDMTVAAVNDLHRAFSQAVPHAASLNSPVSSSRPERLRIGYLSSDFRDHPVGMSMLEAFRHHDRSSFAIHCFAEVRSPDHITEQFRRFGDRWRNIGGMSDAEVAQCIRHDNIHVLVCLAGHFDGNRPQVAALRAAPVQISLHDIATSALSEMDYIIADRWMLPRNHEEYFSERPLRLPQFYLGALPSILPELRPGNGERAPVFGCFNNPAKITPTVLRLWQSILAAMPEGRLLLKYQDRYSSAELRRQILRYLPAEQLCFVTEREDWQSLLARYNEVDVALDTMPFSGSTTSFQALTMGVPVVTWPQNRMVSCWTAAMLRGVQMTELIADSAENYVSIALAVAGDCAAWRQRRPEIRQRLAASRLCDAARWTRHLERLYNAAWRRHQMPTNFSGDGSRQ